MGSKRCLIQQSVLEHLGNRVQATVLGAKSGRHEGLGLGIPSVGVVDGEHDDGTDEETGGRVRLKFEGKRCTEGRDLQPRTESVNSTVLSVPT